MIKNLKDISFSYQGYLTSEILEELIIDIKSYSEYNIDKKNIRNRLYNVSIEALENIIKHSDEQLIKNNKISYTISQTNYECKLTFKSVIYCNNAERINRIFNKLKDKSQSQIKELYKSTILKTKISNKGGAGLGIIEIAKVSNNNIDYGFKKIDKKTCEFILEVNLKYK